MSELNGEVIVDVPYEAVAGRAMYTNDTEFAGSSFEFRGDEDWRFNILWKYPGGIVDKGWEVMDIGFKNYISDLNSSEIIDPKGVKEYISSAVGELTTQILQTHEPVTWTQFCEIYGNWGDPGSCVQ